MTQSSGDDLFILYLIIRKTLLNILIRFLRFHFIIFHLKILRFRILF